MCDINRRIRGSAPPSHSWMAPLMEDMLHDVRTRLTKAVVIGPGRAVLFYGRHSMGEGLTMDKARDAAFLLTGVGTWFGKLAYLAANPMTIQEGQMRHCPSHNRLPSKGEGARMSMCKPAGPTTLQVWPPKRFPYKGCLWGWWLQPSTITTSAPKELRLQ